jgi:hypothetical protein
MEIWHYSRKMKQFQTEETAEDSKHFEIVKIIEDDAPSAVSDKYEIVEQFLTEKDAKDKASQLDNSSGGV